MRVFRGNDVDVHCTFNFDLDFKLTFCQGHKRLRFFQRYAIDGYHFVLRISHSPITDHFDNGSSV